MSNGSFIHNLSITYKCQLGKAGSPNNSGLNSSMESSMRVASTARARSRRGSGTITTCMPAARAPRTPFNESSNTKHWESSKKANTILRIFLCGKLSWYIKGHNKDLYFLFCATSIVVGLIAIPGITRKFRLYTYNGYSSIQTTSTYYLFFQSNRALKITSGSFSVPIYSY